MLSAAGRAGRRDRPVVPSFPGPGAARRAARHASAASRVLDRTRSPARSASRCYLDVVTALTEAVADGERAMPRVCGGRYGLSSKEFTPGDGRRCVRASSHASGRGAASRSASTTTSPAPACLRPGFDIEPPDTVRAVFFGLGSDGTVGANKNTIKILARGRTCTRRATSSTTPRSPDRRPSRTCASVPGRSTPPTWYAGQLHRLPPDRPARPARRAGAGRGGATLLLNCRYSPDGVWDGLSRPVQEQILAKNIDVYAIDAGRIAREAGLAGRINIVLQTCFFAISGVLPPDQAIARIKAVDHQDLWQARR